MIKFTDLSRCWQELKAELVPAYEEIHTSGMVANGKYRNLVEEQIKQITGRKHCRLTSSGTTAIQGALIAWDIIDKKVACTNYSYVASVSQAALLNEVELHDVDQRGHMVLRDDTHADAVIPVSLFGNPVDYEGITSKINHGKVIVDCAQSLGAIYNDRPDGGMGECAVFSFATNKPVPTAGTQGALVWDDDSMCDRVTMAFNNGKLSRNSPIQSYGLNGHAFELQAAQIHFGLTRMAKWQARRTEISQHLIDEFRELPLRVITARPDTVSNWHKFVVVCDRRDELHDYLLRNGVDCQKHYTDDFDKHFGNGVGLPNTKSLCETVLSLPNHQWLRDEEVQIIASLTRQFFQN